MLFTPMFRAATLSRQGSCDVAWGGDEAYHLPTRELLIEAKLHLHALTTLGAADSPRAVALVVLVVHWLAARAWLAAKGPVAVDGDRPRTCGEGQQHRKQPARRGGPPELCVALGRPTV